MATKSKIEPIGITDSELRVYMQYKDSFQDIYKRIHDLEDKLIILEHTQCYSTPSIQIRTDDSINYNYFLDHNIVCISEKDAIQNQIDKCKNILSTRMDFCRRIDGILCQLSKEQYALIKYRYFDKLTLEKIAEKLFSNRQSVNEKLNKMLKFQSY